MTGVAGAVVQLAGLDTIGFHFQAESSIGKTISQRLGASCVANPKPDKGVLVTTRGTDNAFEGKFEKGNGSSVHLDEAKSGNAKTFEALIFMAAAGTGKARMRADTSSRASKTWSTCWTFSSEKSLKSILEAVDGEVVTGTAVRLNSIVLDGLPRIDKARADAIEQAALVHFGHALPVFVKELQRLRFNERPDLLLHLVNTYAAELEATTAAAMRARRAFGVIRLVGEVMKRCGLIPAGAGVAGVVSWAWSCFADNAEMLNPQEKNMRAVETYLRTHIGTTVLQRGGLDKPVGEAMAWYDAGTVYLRADVIERLPGVTLGVGELASAWKAAGLLHEPPTSTKTLAWKVVPGHGTIRHYRLKFELRPKDDVGDPGEVRDKRADGEHRAKMAFVNAGATGGQSLRQN